MLFEKSHSEDYVRSQGRSEAFNKILDGRINYTVSSFMGHMPQGQCNLPASEGMDLTHLCTPGTLPGPHPVQPQINVTEQVNQWAKKLTLLLGLTSVIKSSAGLESWTFRYQYNPLRQWQWPSEWSLRPFTAVVEARGWAGAQAGASCSIFFSFKNVYLFLCFWLHWVFVAMCRLFLVTVSWGLLFIGVRGFLVAVASLVAERRLSTCRAGA